MIHDSVPDGDRARLYDTIFLNHRQPLQGCDAGTWALHSALGSFLAGRPAEHVLILGAGPEGQSAAIALAARGVRRLTFHDPDMSRAASLANLMQECAEMRCTLLASTEGLFHARSAPGVTRGWIDGIVHAPGSNMAPQEISDLAPPLWLVDMAAFAPPTALSNRARAAGCAVLEGAEIALRRGARLLDCCAERSHEGCGLGWLHLDPGTTAPGTTARSAARRSG
ncbi:MAG: hypothetical protein GYB53_18830 [Rhodobacteraceae bacterium]|nr:hypothetical protein [Paracoccaceae bacterium]